MNTALIKELNKEAKTAKADQASKVERDFIRSNWFIFTSTKEAVKGALDTVPEGTGNDVLALLNLNNVLLKKVAMTEMLTFCYTRNKLFREFVDKVLEKRTLTYFFVAGKSAIVVTNAYVLKPEKAFMHKLELEKSHDIYWASVESVRNTLKVF